MKRWIWAASLAALGGCAPEPRTGCDGLCVGGTAGGGETGHSSGAGSSGSTAAAETHADAADGGDSSEGDPLKLDVGTTEDISTVGCGGGGEVEFSNIWIANAHEGTVSKLDTRTLVELGRYQTRPDGAGDPSRTSVNLNGDVAIANRAGGLTKIFARSDECPDTNGVPGVQTSMGAADVRMWGDDDCVAWHVAMDFTSQRPVAWTRGEQDPATCRFEDTKVWTSGTAYDAGRGAGLLSVVLVDGETGAIDEQLELPEVLVESYGGYGGAVDGEGNFWIVTFDGTPALVRVTLEGYDVAVFPAPDSGVYGITVDSQGRPWVASAVASRFDPATELWTDVPFEWNGTDFLNGFGIQEGMDARMWIAAWSATDLGNDEWVEVGGLQAVDLETLALGEFYELPEHVRGVSVDVEGYVWAVSIGDEAYRVDPMTGEYETYDGLSGAYTYSDMTGWGLANAGLPPAG